MRKSAFLLALLALLLPIHADAQTARVVGSCSSPPVVNPVGALIPLAIDQNGNLCIVTGIAANAAATGNAGYPVGATPVSRSVTAADTTTGFISIPATPGQFSYVCGFEISGLGATAATPVSPTVSGLAGATTMTFQGAYTFVAGAAVFNVPYTQVFYPCLVSSAANTAIIVTVPGAAGNTSTTWNVWGYTQ